VHDRRGRRPKIASLLAEPAAALVRQLVRLARDLGVAPTLFAGMRLREQTYAYDDADHPDRPTRVIDGPAYIAEDHALLLGLQQHEDSLCPGCGQPKHVAWHSDMDGWFEVEVIKCQACTVLNAPEGEAGKPALYRVVVDTVNRMTSRCRRSCWA
jgi:hypothetical protein